MIASDVSLLSSGPIIMNASIEGSRSISPIWSGLNCAIATFSGLTPDLSLIHI